MSNALSVALSLLIGVSAGLRAMTPLAAVSWAARCGRLPLEGSWLSFFGKAVTPWIFTALAVVELITDQLPGTPSRKVAIQFGTRIISGALCGAAVSHGIPIAGLLAGAVGAVIGTLGGAAVRGKLAAAFKSDRPAALLEDAVAIGGAALIVMVTP
jgi:uncharacterized membrane protein